MNIQEVTMVKVNFDKKNEQCEKMAMPKLYNVVLFNDEKTEYLFVVLALIEVFDLEVDETFNIVDSIHTAGKCSLGVFSRDIAETRCEAIKTMASEEGFPLRVIIEEYN